MSGLRLEVVHAMQDLDAEGVYPSGDRLVDRLEQYEEQYVRYYRRVALEDGDVLISTPNPNPDAVEPDGEVPLGDEAHGSRPISAGGVPAPDSHEVNVAIYHLVEGSTGVTNHIAVLTNLSPNAVKLRARRVRHEYPEELIHKHTKTISPDEFRYVASIASKLSGEEASSVRAWLAENAPSRRQHPDKTRFRNLESAPP